MSDPVWQPEFYPQVGDWVQWYSHADTKNDPRAAMVTASSDPHRLDLLVWSPQGGEPVRVRSVRYYRDPYLQEYRAQAVKFGGCRERPGGQYYRPDGDVSVDSRILSLHKAGKSPSQVARTIGKSGINKTYVERVLEKAGVLTDGASA